MFIADLLIEFIVKICFKLNKRFLDILKMFYFLKVGFLISKIKFKSIKKKQKKSISNFFK